MNTIVALFIAFVGTINDSLPSCAPVQAAVDSINEYVAENGNGYGEGVLFVYEDCAIGYQD